jgi:hypothetical protein
MLTSLKSKTVAGKSDGKALQLYVQKVMIGRR